MTIRCSRDNSCLNSLYMSCSASVLMGRIYAVYMFDL
jgi:hypothetical protein